MSMLLLAIFEIIFCPAIQVNLVFLPISPVCCPAISAKNAPLNRDNCDKQTNHVNKLKPKSAIVNNTPFATSFRSFQTTLQLLSYINVKNYFCIAVTADVFDWFGFDQTGKSFVHLTYTKQLNPNKYKQEVSCFPCKVSEYSLGRVKL